MKAENSPKKPAIIDLPVAEDGSTPKIIIIGRGTLTGSKVQGPDGEMKHSRKVEALRLHESTMNRVKSLVAGPAYLAVEVLLRRACDVLEKQEQVELVQAKDLES